MDAVPRHLIRTASDAEAVRLGYGWSERAVARVNAFAATLRDPVDPSKPYRFQPWQADIVRQLFGWRRPNRRRRFNRLDVWIPKKNGKTSFISFLLLYFLLMDRELKPVCAGTSITGERAEEFYTEAKCLLGRNPLQRQYETSWCRILEFQDYRHQIKCGVNLGQLYTLPCSADGSEGIKGLCVAIDEAHVTLAKNPALFGALRFAGAGRRQPLVITTSTAGDNVKSRAYEIYADSKKILEGKLLQLHTLPVIFEAPPKDDGGEYTPAEALAANPGVGHVLEASQLADDYQSAKASPRDLADFLRYRLNVWTKRSSAWLNVHTWMKLGRPGRPLADLAGRECVVGIDLSSRCDLTAAVAVFDLGGDRWLFWPHFWLPRSGIELRCRREMDYLAAENAGEITLLDGVDIDTMHVGRWIRALRDEHQVRPRRLAFDPNKAKELAASLTAEGFDCVSVKQGFALSEAALRFEALIKAGRAEHDGNGVMAWCVQNVESRGDLNNKIMPIKPPDATQRVDGVIAAVIGLQVALFDRPVEPNQSEIDRQYQIIEHLHEHRKLPHQPAASP